MMRKQKYRYIIWLSIFINKKFESNLYREINLNFRKIETKQNKKKYIFKKFKKSNIYIIRIKTLEHLKIERKSPKSNKKQTLNC